MPSLHVPTPLPFLGNLHVTGPSCPFHLALLQSTAAGGPALSPGVKVWRWLAPLNESWLLGAKLQRVLWKPLPAVPRRHFPEPLESPSLMSAPDFTLLWEGP